MKFIIFLGFKKNNGKFEKYLFLNINTDCGKYYLFCDIMSKFMI